MIQAINLPQELTNEFNVVDTDTHLINLSHINILIGENNSGKSRFLRGLFINNPNLSYIDNTLADKAYIEFQTNILRQFKYLLNYQHGNNNQITHNDFRNLSVEIDKITKSDINLNSSIKLCHKILKLTKEDFIFPPEGYNSSIWQNQLKQIKEKSQLLLNRINGLNKKMANHNLLYIPTLRGLRPISDEFNVNNDNYKSRTIKDYFADSNPRIISKTIFTGLEIYEDIMSRLLGLEEQRDSIRSFEKFISDFIFKKPITLIPKYKDDVLHIKIDKDPQFEIYNLGDGIQSLITILYPIFINRNVEKIVYIEEPETHLHPKWQKEFLKALFNFKHHTFFISTHSSSFINKSEVHTYSLKKQNKKFLIQDLDSNFYKTRVLNELGYQQSDLFQTNYILWVEGPSDKIYFNYWINKIAPELSENIHYSILFYGGQTLNHLIDLEGENSLQTLLSINQNSGLYIDSDKNYSKEKYNIYKKELKENLERQTKFCWLSKKREIENYIPIEIFINAVEKVHKIKQIEIENGDFIDRCKVTNCSTETKPKQKIKLTDNIYSHIYKTGSTQGIKSNILRKEIEQSVKNSMLETFNINKVRVATEVVNQKPEIQDSELNIQLKKLVLAIKKVNKEDII